MHACAHSQAHTHLHTLFTCVNSPIPPFKGKSIYFHVLHNLFFPTWVTYIQTAISLWAFFLFKRLFTIIQAENEEIIQKWMDHIPYSWGTYYLWIFHFVVASIRTSQINAKFVHGFWICQIEVVSIVAFNNLVFSLPNGTITFIFLSYLHWIMRKYPNTFQTY